MFARLPIDRLPSLGGIAARPRGRQPARRGTAICIV
jgi:hypothetical protein